MKSVCIVTTLWSSVNNWIKPFLKAYHERGIEVSIVCNMDENYEAELKREFPFVHTFPIAFPRGIDLSGSLKSIVRLRSLFKSRRFDMVQYSTPNASLYAALAAKNAGIPVRLYCQWGMLFVTRKGIRRKIFERIERIVCRCSTHVQPDSIGNLEFCRRMGLYDERKSCVIWNGSAKGLDLASYDVTRKEEYATEIRRKYGLADEPVIGFVGRLGREKGCNELLRAFRMLKRDYPRAKLLFVGPIEKEETIEPELLAYFYGEDDIVKTGRVDHVEKYMAAMDVFILPSYREGFGMSVVEASAMAVPVIATKYPGPSGAMEDGITGYAIAIGSAEEIVERVEELLSDPQKARRMGLNGRKFTEEKFDSKIFRQKYMDNRMQLLGLQKPVVE